MPGDSGFRLERTFNHKTFKGVTGYPCYSQRITNNRSHQGNYFNGT